MTHVTLLRASAHAIPLADESVQMCVTSPPYWSLRSYEGEQRIVWGGEAGHEHEWGEEVGTRTSSPQQSRNGAQGVVGPRDMHPSASRSAFTASMGAFCSCDAWYGALGLEPTPEIYVEHMVEVFREVRRVLRRDGTLWLNLGASYANQGFRGSPETDGGFTGARMRAGAKGIMDSRPRDIPQGYKPKDLVPIPWLVAIALQRDGWWLRSDIIWSKPNPMPGSQRDRPTTSHEYVFLLTKAERYYYDAEAIAEPSTGPIGIRYDTKVYRDGGYFRNGLGASSLGGASGDTRTARTVWTIPTSPRPEAHFATFPIELARKCIAAGSAEGDTVLDPFMGSGTTGRAAVELGRRAVGLDLSAAYLHEIAQPYIAQAEPFAAVSDPVERAQKVLEATGVGQGVLI